MKVIPETRRDIHCIRFYSNSDGQEPFMEMQIYVKIKAFPNRGSMAYGV
jgi:hypothetical protein